jgi:hypothetical protein
MKPSLAVLAALSLAGCASSSGDLSGPVVGVPLDLPDHFVVARTGFGKTEEPKADGVCRNPMLDPRDRTELTLRRSAGGRGDYWPEAGIRGSHTYGLTSQQLLRIDCATGKAVGIVAE